MPYIIRRSPASLSFTIWPRFDWKWLPSIGWFLFLLYHLSLSPDRIVRSFNVNVFMGLATITAILMLIRRERIEIDGQQMTWRKTYFGITKSNSAPLADVLGAAWEEASESEQGKFGVDHVVFFLPNQTVKACYGLNFDEFDRMRTEIRVIFPDVVERWSNATIRSKDLTLLNLS